MSAMNEFLDHIKKNGVQDAPAPAAVDPGTQQATIKSRLGALKGNYQQAVAVASPDVKPLQDQMKTVLTVIKTGDYEGASEALDVLEELLGHANAVRSQGPQRLAADAKSENPVMPTEAADPDGASETSNDELAYRANMKRIATELQAALKDKPPDPASAAVHDKLKVAYDMMLEAENNDDFALARELSDEVLNHLNDYNAARAAFRQKQADEAAAKEQAAAKVVYEKKLGPLADGMRRVLASQPAAPSAKKIQSDLARVYETMKAVVMAGDYILANEALDAVAPLIEAYRTEVAAQSTGKKEYLEQFKSIEGVLRKTLDEMPPAGPPLEIHDELVSSAYTMEAAAAGGDYATANRLLLTMAPLIDRYRKAGKDYEKELAEQAAAKAQYEKKIGPILVALGKIAAEAALDDVTKGLQAEIVAIDMQMNFALPQANYVALNGFADELVPLIEQYQAARTRVENDPKLNYERVRPTIQILLDAALAPPRQDKFMAAMQGKVAALKGKMEKAAASKKYDVAYPHLLELKQLLDQFYEEEKKSPQSCIWVLAVTASVSQDVQAKYNEAANKLDELADAYDKALKAHQATLDNMKEKRRVKAAFLEAVFMIALPGVIGGAASAGLKNYLDKAANTLAGGGLVDGTKDTLKFLTKLVVGMGIEPPKPEKPGRIDGSGVTLTRSIARELRAEQTRVVKALKALDDLVAAKDKDCTAGKPIRVEGDPRQAFADDPFLKIIASIGAVDEKGFGTEIWREWIDQYAYQLQEQLFGVTHMEPKKYAVKKSFDDDIIPEIEKQVSSAFKVRAELEKMEKAVHDKLDSKGHIPDLA